MAFAAGFALASLVALIGVELVILRRREYLPSDPSYVVEATVGPAAGSTGSPLRIAVLGDSTVAGVGSPTAHDALPVLIARRVAEATGRAVHVTGFGVSGARTATLVAGQLPLVEPGHDAVVLVIGSNDATHATPWWAVRAATAEMLDRAVAITNAVVLAGTPRFSGTEIIPEPLRTFVDRYSGVLRREQRAAADAVPGVRFVDLAADASPRFAGVPEATSADGFHPSPVGYGFWADAIAPSVASALADRG
jgi:lysophospholipase L1-like esterase